MHDKVSDFSGGTASPATLSIINRVSPEGTALTFPLFQPEDATAFQPEDATAEAAIPCKPRMNKIRVHIYI